MLEALPLSLLTPGVELRVCVVDTVSQTQVRCSSLLVFSKAQVSAAHRSERTYCPIFGPGKLFIVFKISGNSRVLEAVGIFPLTGKLAHGEAECDYCVNADERPKIRSAQHSLISALRNMRG